MPIPFPILEVMFVACTCSFASKLRSIGNLGGIGLFIGVDRMKNKFRNVDMFDGIMVGIVSLLGAFVAQGHLKVTSFIMAAKQPILHSWRFGITLLGREGDSPNLLVGFIV